MPGGLVVRGLLDLILSRIKGRGMGLGPAHVCKAVSVKIMRIYLRGGFRNFILMLLFALNI